LKKRNPGCRNSKATQRLVLWSRELRGNRWWAPQTREKRTSMRRGCLKNSRSVVTDAGELVTKLWTINGSMKKTNRR
jgi:hypothetical protein